ncbi:MAG: chymotrypsin family serine protease, partial [Desulfocucumaceae bacterium]
EIGKVRLFGERTQKMRPAQPGSSIGHYKVTAGTFGAVVKDIKTQELLILSNNHILANGSDGRDGRSALGDPILQPGSYDGGSKNDQIAELLRFWPLVRKVSQSDCPVAVGVARLGSKFVHILRPNYNMQFVRVSKDENIIDAALAKPLSPDLIKPDIFEVGIPRGTAEVEVSGKVLKSGRSSGLTSGSVDAIGVSLQVEMSDSGDVGFFSQQVVAEMNSQGGDSGSLVLDEQMRAVGLLFAGSDRYTIFNRIQNVFTKLGVDLA